MAFFRFIGYNAAVGLATQNVEVPRAALKSRNTSKVAVQALPNEFSNTNLMAANFRWSAQEESHECC